MARSSFQGCTRGIPGSIPRGNNAWPVRMPLHMNRISRPPLVGRNRCEKKKKKKIAINGLTNEETNWFIHLSSKVFHKHIFPFSCTTSSHPQVLLNFSTKCIWQIKTMPILVDKLPCSAPKRRMIRCQSIQLLNL